VGVTEADVEDELLAVEFSLAGCNVIVDGSITNSFVWFMLLSFEDFLAALLLVLVIVVVLVCVVPV
jgi:hypothetical protein